MSPKYSEFPGTDRTVDIVILILELNVKKETDKKKGKSQTKLTSLLFPQMKMTVTLAIFGGVADTLVMSVR